MKEKELIELLTSIIEANRTFYVGAASPINNDGEVSLNGISAKAIGGSDINDVIVKDSQTGIWYAFVRGYGQQALNSRNISLFQQHPQEKKAGGFFIFIAAESLQDKLLVTQIKQLSGTYQLGDYPVYFGDIAPWIITAPVAYVTEDDYLNYSSSSGIHSVIGNAIFETTDERLNLKESFFSLSGMAKIAIKGIKKDSEVDKVFLEFVFTPSIATSGIRRAVERWSLGLSKDGLAAAGGAFNSGILKKSLTIGFKNEKNKEYGDFYAWYKHVINLTEQVQDPAAFVLAPQSCSVSQLEMVTEQPGFSDPFAVTQSTILASAIRTIPPPIASLSSGSIIVDFHYGDGSFNPDTELTSLAFSKNDSGRVRSKIKYVINKSTIPIARKAKLYIEVGGIRRYARHVRYEDTDQYRIGFFEAISDKKNTDLFFYVSPFAAIPQNTNKASATTFLLNEYVAFPETGERVYAADNYLWANNFKSRGSPVFDQNGFVDASFSEEGDIGKCTFFRETQEGLYQTPQAIQVEILPNTEWVYSEEIEFYDDTGVLIGTNPSPFPRLTKESKIRVRIRDSNPPILYLCGRRGRCLEDFEYQAHQKLLLITQQWRTDTIDRFYFPGKSAVSIVHEYPAKVWRAAKPYITIAGQRYYGAAGVSAGTEATLLVFRQADNAFADGKIYFVVELDTDTPRFTKPAAAGLPIFPPSATDPFSSLIYYTFPVGGEKKYPTDNYLWVTGSSSGTPGYDNIGYVDPTFSRTFSGAGNETIFSGVPDQPSWVPVTIELDFYPEENWGKSERITIDGSVIREGPYVIDPLFGENVTYSSLRVVEAWKATGNTPYEEDSVETQQISSGNTTNYPCLGTVSTQNKDPLVPGRDIVFGFEHLLPSESFTINMASTLLSFSGTSMQVFGDGRILFGELELIPFLAALDTTDFNTSDLVIAGYVGYQEGFIEEVTSGEDKIRALRIRWMRGYPFDPGKSNYYDEFNNDQFVNLEAVFVDLPDRVDVIFRYKQIGAVGFPIQWNTANYNTGYNFNPNIASQSPNIMGIPIAGIQRDNCIFEGSGSLDNQQALVTGSVSSEILGDYVFYIKDGEIHGYNEVTLFEGGNTPIRKSVVPYKDILRPQGCLVRIESKKKVSFYLTDKITEGEIDLTSPLPPLLSANTLIGDPAEPNPLLNKSKLI